MVSRDQEDTFYRQVLSSFGTWLGRVSDLVLAGFKRVGSRPDPSAMFAATPLWTTLLDRMMVTLRQDATADAQKYVSDVGKSTWLDYQMKITRNLLANLPDEVHALIVDQIQQGTAAGENQAQIAHRIDQVLSITASERWPHRARLIAVTEVHKASNLAIQAAGQILQANQSGPILKQWNALSDDKVREDHREVDGKMILLAKNFTVGGIPMACPGDPSAPADQVCNCRCSLRLRGVQA